MMPKEQDGSLIPAQGQLEKSLIKDRMNRSLDKHDLFGKSQRIFSKGKQCLKNLLGFSVLDFNRDLDRDHQLGINYLVFQKVLNKFFH